MLNPGDIVDAIATALRAIPALVTAQGAHAVIAAVHPEFASQANFQTKLHQANPGDILVRWLGTGPATFGENRIWKHQIGIYIRPFDTASTDSAGSHYLAAKLVIDGVPTGGDGSKLMNQQIIAGLDLMDIPTLRMVVDNEGLEYALVTFAIPEIGDN
jgi:hypothetical protein